MRSITDTEQLSTQMRIIIDGLQAIMPLWAHPVWNGEKEMTLEALLSRWLLRCEQDKNVKATTVSCYAQTVYRQIIPGLGHCFVSEVTDEKLEEFLAEKRETGRLDGRGASPPKVFWGSIKSFWTPSAGVCGRDWCPPTLFWERPAPRPDSLICGS